MRLGFVIILVSAIGFVGGCNQVENNSGNSSAGSLTSEPIRTGPAVEVAEKEIDLGDIPVEEAEVVGQILLYNPGSKPLRITKVTGPCSCFIGSAGDKLIQPGDAGELVIRFDKSKIDAGPARKLANIYTNDPENELTKVYFNFTIGRDPIEEQLRALRVALAGIKHEMHLLRSEIKKTQIKKTPREGIVKNRPSDTTVYKINIGESPVLGAKDAAVTIVEFGDFQCSYCVREFPKIKQILQEYPKEVRFVLKHYPLGFHKKAPPAHAATELARLEGGNEAFWKMHDLILANPKKLEIADLRGYAQSLNLDLKQFDTVMVDPDKITELLQADLAEAKKCKVRATPTVLINGLKMTNRTLEGYQSRINQILKKKVATKN